MSTEHLVRMTDEQRAEAKIQRLAAQDFAKNNLILDRPDEAYWKAEASARGIRMPQWHILGTEVKYVKRACKKLSIDVKEYVESTGFKTLKEFAETNPKFNAVAQVGLAIEYAVGKGL